MEIHFAEISRYFFVQLCFVEFNSIETNKLQISELSLTVLKQNYLVVADFSVWDYRK